MASRTLCAAMRLVFGFGVIACLWPPAPVRAQAQLKAIEACTPSGPDGVCFGLPSGLTTARQINFAAPGPGQALVMVSGSGWCQNANTEADEVADFETQIVDEATLQADHNGSGGLRFLSRLPQALPPAPGGNVNPIIVPINFGASRVFKVKSARTKRYYLNVHVTEMDAHVGCVAYALNMTVLFTPN